MGTSHTVGPITCRELLTVHQSMALQVCVGFLVHLPGRISFTFPLIHPTVYRSLFPQGWMSRKWFILLFRLILLSSCPFSSLLAFPLCRFPSLLLSYIVLFYPTSIVVLFIQTFLQTVQLQKLNKMAFLWFVKTKNIVCNIYNCNIIASFIS